MSAITLVLFVMSTDFQFLGSEKLTTLKLTGNQYRVFEINKLSDIKILINYLNQSQDRFAIVGEGSNCYFSDRFNGVVVKNKLKGIRVVEEDENSVLVNAFSGENWDRFLKKLIKAGYFGLENLTAIPGTVGAAPVQNIGAYGVEVGSFIQSVEVIDLQSGTFHKIANEDLLFGYRDSLFKKSNAVNLFILSVNFKLSKTFNPVLEYAGLKEKFISLVDQDKTALHLSKMISDIRWSKLPDPVSLANAGSFFKNPDIPSAQWTILEKDNAGLKGIRLSNGRVKLAAAQLIELSGCRQLAAKNIGLYDKHALILVNHDKGTYKELTEFTEAIKLRVLERFQVHLEQEVRVHV